MQLRLGLEPMGQDSNPLGLEPSQNPDWDLNCLLNENTWISQDLSSGSLSLMAERI